MKKNKHIISILIGTLVIGSSSLGFATPTIANIKAPTALDKADKLIKDTVSKIKSSTWSKEFIVKANESKLFVKTKTNVNTDFTKNITREEFGELVMNYVNKKLSAEQIADLTHEQETNYSDTKNPLLKKLSSLGIINGVDSKDSKEQRFLPKNNISREEISVILSRTESKIQNLYFDKVENEDLEVKYLKDFIDKDKISDWAKKGVAELTRTGLINGMGDGTFNPKGFATKEQAIKILVTGLERSPLKDFAPEKPENEIKPNKTVEITKEVVEFKKYTNEADIDVFIQELGEFIIEYTDEMIEEIKSKDKDINKYLTDKETVLGKDFNLRKEYSKYIVNKIEDITRPENSEEFRIIDIV